MTTLNSEQKRPLNWRNFPLIRQLRNFNIGPKLSLGFGSLLLLMLLVSLGSITASNGATQTIRQTNQLSVPIALSASRAQANLLIMQADVRGYLALGDPTFQLDYENARLAFEAELAVLNGRSANLSDVNQNRLAELEAIYQEWIMLPPTLFELRDDQLAREPAYRVLATDGVVLAGQVLIDVQSLIESQALRPPTGENVTTLKEMADFQGSFAAMLSGLRNYVTTQNRAFRQEYEVNLQLNEIVWAELAGNPTRLTPEQQAQLADIEDNRSAFLVLPSTEIFPVLESEQARQDLFLFSQEAVPKAELMLDLLNDLTNSQQMTLATDLQIGSMELAGARSQTIVGGIFAALLGVMLAYLLQDNIAGPVRRLTGVAVKIRDEDLNARATVEASDEVGVLAGTFNEMTGRLQSTLGQVRKEKGRADNLLNVVIPIGVELSAENDFNQMLEKMLIEAKRFCYADAGTLYLYDAEEEQLQFVIVRNDSQQVALGGTTGKKIPFLPLALYGAEGEANERNTAVLALTRNETINIPDVYAETRFELTGIRHFDKETNYRTHSMLAIPLRSSKGEPLGVLQLINAQDPKTGDPISFDPNLQQMMESFSSLAEAALEAYIREQALRQEIKQLRIEIDEVKLQQQVRETVDTDFFQELQVKAREIRQRRQDARQQVENS